MHKDRAVAKPDVAARSLRIAAHIAASEWGGAEQRSLALLTALARRGHAVSVYCNTDRIAGEARARGLYAAKRPLRGDAIITDAFRLAATLRRHPPDILLLITFKRIWLGALAARLARVPRVVARVGLATDVARRFKYRFVLRRWIDDVVLNAHSLNKPFVESLSPHSRARITIIPNGVDMPPAALSREQARAALGVPVHAFVVGTVARLVTQKRIDRLIHAVALDDATHAVITGDGALRSELESLTTSLGVTDRVHFTGYRPDIGNVHAALDAYVVTSEQEGMSSGMLEALASGIPVISTPVSGAREALLGRESCGIVVSEDAGDIAAAIATLKDNVALRQQMSGAAQRVSAERYGSEGMVDAWEVLLRGSL